MRICIVTVGGYVHGTGGMQAHTVDLGRGLVAEGHEVEIITARHPDGETSTEFAGCRWHFVDAPSRLPRLPIRHPDWLRLSADAFDRLHAADPFDVVHSESTSALGLLRRKVHRSVPLAAKFHGNYLGLARATIGRGLRSHGVEPRVREAKHLVWITAQYLVPFDEIYRFRACEAMVPSRQQLAGTRHSYLLDPARMHVVENGIDAELFSPGGRDEARRALSLGDGPLLLCVGRLARDKGLHTAIEALTRLPAELRARLIVVGDGPERPVLEALARERGVADHVVFAGRQPQEVVAQYLSASDVFLFPTERDEAAPLVPLEAMASGVPVVASAVGGVPDAVEAGVSGFLIPPGDAEQCAAFARRLLEDPALRQRIVAAARERILAHHTFRTMTLKTLDVYRIATERMRGR